MEKTEIIAGIKLAIENNHTLEEAKQSFINAGYNRQDVEDSAKALTSSVTAVSEIQPIQPSQQVKEQSRFSRIQQQFPTASQIIVKPEKSKKGIIIFLFIILILLIGVLLGFIFFKEQIMNLLKILGF